MFVLAIDAGHYQKTAGRRVSKKFDKNQTREWELNNRVALAIEEASKQYKDVKVIRVDDPTGKTFTGLQKRCDIANEAEADFYQSIHHNAGVGGGKGGGTTIFIRKNPKDNSKEYMDAIYECCLKNDGLKGNRATPKKEKNYYVLKHTKMPAVLTEYGFMDSSTDAPVIIGPEYSKKMGYATMEAIAKVAKLKKKTETNTNNNKEEHCKVEVRVLKKGAKGEDVKAMQLLLIGYGYKMTNNGKTYCADGSFGAATENAVKAFQKAEGLSDDGSCGPKTWNKLLGVK